MRWCLTFLLGMLLSTAAFASERKYPDANFRIDIPDDWAVPSVLPKEMQAGFISADRTMSVEVLIARGHGRVVTSDFFASVRKSLSNRFGFGPVHTLQGAQQHMEYTIATDEKGRQMGTFVVGDGEVLYMLRVTSIAGGIETSAQLLAIARSFTVLAPARIPKTATPVG